MPSCDGFTTVVAEMVPTVLCFGFQDLPSQTAVILPLKWKANRQGKAHLSETNNFPGLGTRPEAEKSSKFRR